MIARPSENKWVFGPPEKRSLPQEGKVLIYLSVEFERYWAEGARTFMVKESSLEESQNHEVKALYDRIRDGMENEKKVAQFHRRSLQMIKKAGFDTLPDYGLGQGIGLSPKEPPVIAGEDRSMLKTGMCLSLFLGVRNRAAGPTVLGETICLSRTGPEVLTR
jgi:Xaa-Pro aminopeptidase